MRTHCTGRQAGQLPGPMLRPCRGAQACGLRGNGLPHQRARWFAMTGLGVRWVWRQRGGSGKLTAGASPRPTVRVSAMHPAQRTRLRSCTRRAGARPRRTAANLPGSSAPTHQGPEPVIARSAATWQSAPRNAAALHRPRGRSWHSTYNCKWFPRGAPPVGGRACPGGGGPGGGLPGRPGGGSRQ